MKKNRIKDNTSQKRRGFFSAARIQAGVFCLLLGAGLVVSFLLPLRPAVSQSEKRTLSVFPAFSVQALFSGSYFRGIDLWFSDTFPLRENIIGINSYLRGLYGIKTVQIKGEVEQGDEIPDVPGQTAAEETAAPPGGQTTPPETAAPQPATTQAAEQGTTQSFGAVLLYGNGAYEYYNFRKDLAGRYAALINSTAARLDGDLYEIVVPTSTGIMLPDSIKSSINSSDQKKATDYLYSLMDTKVKTISIYDTLIAHNTEYLYFRTDHHWTALGAYYAYEEWAKVKGVEAIPLARYEKASYEGFLGSFYASTEKSPALGRTPDTVEVFKPFNNTKMTITDKNGRVLNWNVITDVSAWSESGKYGAFIGGDHPYSVIENKDLTDGSSCLVVKESFANTLIPFLVPHYQTIHIVDYRYWNGNVADFANQNGVKDVLYINNISALRGEPLVERIEKISG